MAKKQRPLQLPSSAPTWVMLLAITAALRQMQLARFRMATIAKRLRPRERKHTLRHWASLNYALFETQLRNRHVVVQISPAVLKALLTAMRETLGTSWTINRFWNLLGNSDDKAQRKLTNLTSRILARARTLAQGKSE
ncbi:hypothetical protein HY477_02885 [Candidatus Uhrbacteria bacterium]|nr:hypothetical protein [Candidatus Uhrbacteria bacterium]